MDWWTLLLTTLTVRTASHHQLSLFKKLCRKNCEVRWLLACRIYYRGALFLFYSSMLPTAVYCLLALLSTLADRQRPLRLLESSGIIKVIAGPFRFSSKQSHSQRTNKQYRHYRQATLRTSRLCVIYCHSKFTWSKELGQGQGTAKGRVWNKSNKTGSQRSLIKLNKT